MERVFSNDIMAREKSKLGYLSEVAANFEIHCA